MPLELIAKLHSHAQTRPDAPALLHRPNGSLEAVTWQEFSGRVDAIAGQLIAAFPSGSTIMLCSVNRPEISACFLGILAAGMTVFPVALDIAAPELASAAQRSGAIALIAVGQPKLPAQEAFGSVTDFTVCGGDAKLWTDPSARGENPVGRPDGGLLLLSSGTTGRPKIVYRDARSIDAVSRNMVDSIGFLPADVVLAATPLCHSYGMEHGLLCPTWSGAGACLYDRFDLLTAMQDLKDKRVTIFPGVPFMFEMLAGEAGLPPTKLSLRIAYSAGGPLPRSLYDTFERQYNVQIAQLYGATEIGSVSYNDPKIVPFDPASVGRAMNDVSMLILDPLNPDVSRPLPAGAEGHVAISAPSMLRHYLDGDVAPTIDGHFLTGDLGRLDATGALTVTGRIKLLIDVAGRKVNPLEVEQIIAAHPDVAECVVVAMKVSETLCRLKAFVTPARLDVRPDPRELRSFARARLSAYKVPRLFTVLESLPRSAAGKVLRQKLEAEATRDE